MKSYTATNSYPLTSEHKRSKLSELSLFYALICMCFLLIPFEKVKAQINVENTITMSRIALNIDDYTSAIKLLNRVTEYRPNSAEAFYLRAYAKFSLEDYEGAEYDCNKAIQLHPFNEEYYSLRALCRLNLKKYALAATDYSKVLVEHPDDINQQFNLAYAYLKNHQYDKAEKESHSIKLRHPDYAKIYLFDAQLFFEKKDTVRALAAIDTLISYRPENAYAWTIKGQYAYEKKEYELADSLLRHADKLDSNNPDIAFSLALTANARYNIDDAIKYYNQTLLLRPNHFAALFNRALLLSLKGDDNKAIADYNVILNIDPHNDMARYNRAILNINIGQYKKAIHDLNLLIELYPQFIAAYELRAQCYRNTHQHKKAQNDESYIKKYELDIAFAKRKPLKNPQKARRTPQEIINKSTMPITKDSIDIHVYGNAVMGKIQNIKTELHAMPILIVGVTKEPLPYQCPIYYAELEKLKSRLRPLLESVKKERYTYANPIASYRIEILPAGIQPHLSLPPLKETNHPCDARFMAAILLTQTYHLEAALDSINLCVQDNPHDVLPLLQRASIYYLRALEGREEKKDFSPATELLKLSLDDLNAALKIDPQQPYVLYNRANVNSRLHHYNLAIKDLKACLKIYPDFAAAHFNLALLYLKNEDKENAALHFRKAGELGIKKAYALLKQIRKMHDIN